MTFESEIVRHIDHHDCHMTIVVDYVYHKPTRGLRDSPLGEIEIKNVYDRITGHVVELTALEEDRVIEQAWEDLENQT